MQKKLILIIALTLALVVSLFFAYKYQQTYELNQKSISHERFDDLKRSPHSESYKIDLKSPQRLRILREIENKNPSPAEKTVLINNHTD